MKMSSIIQLFLFIPLIACGKDTGSNIQVMPEDKPKVTVEAADYNSYQCGFDVSKAKWDWYYALTVDRMGVSPQTDDKVNEYGSWADGPTLDATGYFRLEKYKDCRWVLVDPKGKIHIDASALTIKTGIGEDNKKYFRTKFNDDPEQWIFETMDSLHRYGFNGSGAWGDEEMIRFYNDFPGSKGKCTYCPIMNPMSDYGYIKGVAEARPGNTGYVNNCIPVFDPEFKEYCEKMIPEFVKQYKDDPNVVGYFSDNEMPLRKGNLEGFLKMDEKDYGYRAAKTWMEKNGYTEVTPEARLNFLGYVAETYYRIVSGILKKADPNHLYLGSRLAGDSKTFETVYKAAAKYCDIVSMNYYGHFEVLKEDITKWETWADTPYMITEFYTKGEDSGLGNTSGDGWIVRTQKDRGLHYENFIIGLLRSGKCVGWCWCKYLDNDPTALHAEASNKDANKGIFDNRYEPYRDLVKSMSRVNNVRYSILSQYWLYTR